MEVKILAFGIAKDILGGAALHLSVPLDLTVEGLMKVLKERYPAFQELTSLAIAVNADYAQPDQIIKADDEVVIIPPVAGG